MFRGDTEDELLDEIELAGWSQEIPDDIVDEDDEEQPDNWVCGDFPHCYDESPLRLYCRV